MSHAPSSNSSVLNLITSTSNLPMFRALGNLFTHTAAAFEYATYQNPQSRFTAVMFATMSTAFGIWGIQFTLGRVPFHFVRKTLVPVAEWGLKAGLAWVIFKALDHSAQELSRSPTISHDPRDPRGPIGGDKGTAGTQEPKGRRHPLPAPKTY